MNEEVRSISQVFSFVGSIKNKKNTISTTLFDNVNELSNKIIRVHEDEKNKLPYHINILDLLWANENAHSRIFAELLKQNSFNKYEILESFFEYLNYFNANFNIKPNKPRITSEKDRIDLLILDTDFALIIENKIHGATDQPEQLARYIDKVRNLGFRQNNIWVVYLTKYQREPQNQSWGNYKTEFKERTFNISFRHDVLHWLEETVLPNCKIKDIYLKSTIEQYVDHLKGIFNLRTNQNKMNRELQNHIRQELELNSNPETNHRILMDKLFELQKVEGYISDMLLSTEKECWQKWLNQLKLAFPNYETISYLDDKKYPKIGIILEYKGAKFTALIEKENGIYYGLGRHNASETLHKEIQDLFKSELSEFKETPWWYGLKYSSFENVYSQLETLIYSVIQILEDKNASG